MNIESPPVQLCLTDPPLKYYHPVNMPVKEGWKMHKGSLILHQFSSPKSSKEIILLIPVGRFKILLAFSKGTLQF